MAGLLVSEAHMKSVGAIAVIPARGGSKRVPHKNVRHLDGKPLFLHSVEQALECQDIASVVVSSDSDSILRMAESAGAIALKRPLEMATDSAPTDPVIIHAVEAFKQQTECDPAWTVTLQPTCPIRTPALISKCLFWAKAWDVNSLFTAYDSHFVWRRAFGKSQNYAQVNCILEDRKPRQLMRAEERVYAENGSVYVTMTSALLEHGMRVVYPVQLMTMPKEDSIDIDTEYDFWLAEQRIRYLREEGS